VALSAVPLIVLQVAETCQLALLRLEWLRSGGQIEGGVADNNPYSSVDPAPPAPRKSIPELRGVLLDESLPLFDRYRAMFALRNNGSEEAVLALGDGVCVFVCVYLVKLFAMATQYSHYLSLCAVKSSM